MRSIRVRFRIIRDQLPFGRTILCGIAGWALLAIGMLWSAVLVLNIRKDPIVAFWLVQGAALAALANGLYVQHRKEQSAKAQYARYEATSHEKALNDRTEREGAAAPTQEEFDDILALLREDMTQEEILANHMVRWIN